MRRKLLLLLAGILVLQTVLLAADHEPSFFFGDSAVYLTTAIGKWIPPDRSFIYGLLLRPLAVWPRSLLPVIVFQVICAAVASWLVGFCLVRYFAVQFEIAAILSILCSIEPLQLMAARYILPDSLATSLFAVLMTLSFSYLKTASVSLLAAIQIVAVTLVSLRLGFLPLAIVLAACLPLLHRRAVSFWKLTKRARFNWMRGVRYIVLPLLFSVALNQTLLFGYRYLYGEMTGKSPAYSYRTGLFMLADFAPLVKSTDYPIGDDRQKVFGSLAYAPGDPHWRLAQRWADGGLCRAVIDSAEGNEDLADARASQTAWNAIKREPFGLLKLSAQTYREYFIRESLRNNLLIEQGRYYNLLPREAAVIQETFGIDVPRRRFDSLTKWLQARSGFWCWCLLIFPLFYLIYLFTARHLNPSKWICALCAVLFLLEATVTVDHPTIRYLLPLAWLVFVAAGSLKIRRGLAISRRYRSPASP